MNAMQPTIESVQKEIHEELKKSSIDHKVVSKLVVELKNLKKLQKNALATK